MRAVVSEEGKLSKIFQRETNVTGTPAPEITHSDDMSYRA